MATSAVERCQEMLLDKITPKPATNDDNFATSQ